MYPFCTFEYNVSVFFFRQKLFPYFSRIRSPRSWAWIIFYHLWLRWFVGYWVCHFSQLFKGQLLIPHQIRWIYERRSKEKNNATSWGKEDDIWSLWKACFIFEMAAVWNCWQIGSVGNCPRPDVLVIWVQVKWSKVLYKCHFPHSYHHCIVV